MAGLVSRRVILVTWLGREAGPIQRRRLVRGQRSSGSQSRRGRKRCETGVQSHPVIGRAERYQRKGQQAQENVCFAVLSDDGHGALFVLSPLVGISHFRA
jgi:hypothetical protein